MDAHSSTVWERICPLLGCSASGESPLPSEHRSLVRRKFDKSNIKIRIANNHSADEPTIGLYAVIGMQEGKEISRRTRQEE